MKILIVALALTFSMSAHAKPKNEESVPRFQCSIKTKYPEPVYACKIGWNPVCYIINKLGCQS